MLQNILTVLIISRTNLGDHPLLASEMYDG